MKRFVKIVDGWKLLTTFAKQGSEYAYDICLWSKGVFKALLNTYDRAFFLDILRGPKCDSVKEHLLELKKKDGISPE